MKPLLGSMFPELFQGELTEKSEEAIVDRPHTLATAAKDDAHFRRKMGEAFREARRILKPEGRLLLMFGHKKFKAWDAVMSELFGAGFTPVVSWPVHTERKVKFSHGHIAALSTSCLLVCVPTSQEPKGTVVWTDFSRELQTTLRQCLQSYKQNHLYGSDLVTATIAPVLTAFKQYDRVVEKGKAVTLEGLLKRLPELIRECELEALLADKSLRRYRKSKEWLAKLAATEGMNGGFPEVFAEGEVVGRDSLMDVAAQYSDALLDGSPIGADGVWASLSDGDRHAARVFFEAVTLLTPASSALRRRAEASLGRIAMKLREQYVAGNGKSDYGW